MTDDYVTYEQANRLWELGYDEPCYTYYSTSFCTDGTPTIVTKGYALPGQNSVITQVGQISCPTLYQAAKWLRQKFNWSVRVNYSAYNSSWFYDILNLDNFDYDDSADLSWPTYEEAMTYGISHIINLIHANKE